MLKALYSTLVEIADSKKAVMAILSVGAMLGAKYGLGFDPTQAFELISPLLVAIAGQAHVDAQAAKVANDNAPVMPVKQAQAGFISYMLLPLIALAMLTCIFAMVACLSSSQKKAGEHAAFTCALDAVAPHVQPIESALGQLDYKAALSQLNLPDEAIDCGIKTVLAVLTAPRGSEPSLVVLHGREWLAEHGK